MIAYLDEYKDRFGVEPICKVMPIAPSTYYEHKAKERDPDRRSDRVKRDEQLKPVSDRPNGATHDRHNGATFCG